MGSSDVPVHLLTEDKQKSHEEREVTGPWRHLVASAGAFVSGGTPLSPGMWSTTILAGQHVDVGCDEATFFPDLTAVFGGQEPSLRLPHADCDVTITIIARSPVEGYGYFQVSRLGIPIPARDYFIGLEKSVCPYRELGDSSGWTLIAEESGNEPVLLFRDQHCLFRRVETWPLVALSLFFRAVFGTRRNAILFHASSVGVFDRGFLFAGPRRAGKSTLSLALAARGHHFLGDEIAWYLPDTHELIDFRRPVGVREGPQAALINKAMTERAPNGIAFHDSLRLPIDALVPQQAARPTRLDSVFILRGFEPVPRVVPVLPTLEHAALLQPLPVSMLNAAPGRRLLQMTRLLASVKMYDLYPGHPDATAILLEEVATRS